MLKRVNVDQFLIDLPVAARHSGFDTVAFGQIGDYPLFALIRKGTPSTLDAEKRTIYLSAGIHGDEPAGPLALLELLQADALPRQHNYYLCPMLNPTGLVSGTRESAAGIDLNRDYRDFQSLEIQSHHAWVQSHIDSIDLALHLHEDWEATGFYLYELNLDDQPSLTPQILAAAKRHLPIETTTRIDGHRAKAGVIRPTTLPKIREGLPEALYFHNHFGGINYTLEAPSADPLEARVKALKAAVLAAI